MSPVLLLVHGWSYDSAFWEPMRAELDGVDSIAWDLGFFGRPARPRIPEGRPVVAVGHSYGAQWLMRERPVAWTALVAINGFPRFAAARDFPAGVQPGQIDRLSSAVAEAPVEAISGFHQRCGDAAALPGEPDEPRLQEVLDHLRHWDTRPADVDLALCGETDKVVPPALSRAAFDRIAWHPGGHLLPLHEPAWCAEQIRNFLK